MAITTVRPNGATGAANYTVTGAASVQVALNDDLDASYIVRTSTTQTSTVQVEFGTISLTSSQTVRRVRLRVRAATPTASSRIAYTITTTVSGILRLGATYQRKGLAASATTYTGPWFTTAPGGGAWTQAAIDSIQVTVQDYATASGDRATTYELYLDVDVVSQPTVTVTAPTGTVTSTSRPSATWTYSDTDGDLQTFYQIRVFTDAQYGAGGFGVSTSDYVWDSGAVASGVTTASIDEILPDDTYRAYVRVGKTLNAAPYWSDWAYSQFTVNVTAPTAPTLTLNHASAQGRVTISALGAAPTGFDSQTFELQRSTDQISWDVVRGGDALLPDGIGLVATSDYEAPRGVTVYYRARAIGVIGSAVFASDWGTTASVVVSNDGLWWMKPVDEPQTSVSGVRVAPGFSETVIEPVGVFRPIGRNAAVVVSSGIQGYDGTFSISVIGDQEWTDIESILRHLGTIYVETPLGTSKYIRVISRSWSVEGRSTTPVRRVEVEYVEATS